MNRSPSSPSSQHGAWSQSSLQSTLPLQVLLFFQPYYWILFYVIAVTILIYKALVYPYPITLLGTESTALVFLALLDASRMILGHKGNLTSARLPLLLFLLLGIPVVVGHVYFVNYQTYVMKLDQIINGIALVFVCSEMLLAIFIILAVLSSR